MKVQFICYPKCSTCQKAKKWLDEKGVEYEIRDIKLDNPTYAELKKWYHESGLDIKKFFNTSGLLYKEMDLKLVKRPIAVAGDKVLVGFKESEWSAEIV